MKNPPHPADYFTPEEYAIYKDAAEGKINKTAAMDDAMVWQECRQRRPSSVKYDDDPKAKGRMCAEMRKNLECEMQIGKERYNNVMAKVHKAQLAYNDMIEEQRAAEKRNKKRSDICVTLKPAFWDARQRLAGKNSCKIGEIDDQILRLGIHVHELAMRGPGTPLNTSDYKDMLEYSQTRENETLVAKQVIKLDVDFAQLKLAGSQDPKHSQQAKATAHTIYGKTGNLRLSDIVVQYLRDFAMRYKCTNSVAVLYNYQVGVAALLALNDAKTRNRLGPMLESIVKAGMCLDIQRPRAGIWSMVTSTEHEVTIKV